MILSGASKPSRIFKEIGRMRGNKRPRTSVGNRRSNRFLTSDGGMGLGMTVLANWAGARPLSVTHPREMVGDELSMSCLEKIDCLNPYIGGKQRFGILGLRHLSSVNGSREQVI